MLKRHDPYLSPSRFDPLAGPSVMRTLASEDEPEGGGGDDEVRLSKKALEARIKRAMRSGRNAMLREYQLTEDELAEFAAGRRDPGEADAGEPGVAGGEKPADKPAAAGAKPASKPPMFDPEAFKAEMLKSVSEAASTSIKAALAERDTARQTEAQKATEAQRVRDAMTAAGIKEADLAEAYYERHVGKLDEAARKAFDPKAWFGELATKHPTLKGVEEKPADSGGNGAEKPRPADGKDKPPAFNANTAKPAEIAARMAEIKRNAARAPQQ